MLRPTGYAEAVFLCYHPGAGILASMLSSSVCPTIDLSRRPTVLRLALTIAALAWLGSAASSWAPVAAAQPPGQPNIVLILADDLGWADVGFNVPAESRADFFYETPNLDALAASGMRFPFAYSGGPNCLPTRACLLSGMYTPRTNIWTPGGESKGDPALMKLDVPARQSDRPPTIPSELSLAPEVNSVAEVLKSAGYVTARFGKWHVGDDTQGFDVSSSDGDSGPDGRHYGKHEVTRRLTEASVAFIEEHRNRPFFLYLSHWFVHTPIRADPEVVAKYERKLASRRWSRAWNPTYAAMIEAVDQSVASVQGKLDELGLSANTLVIFSSDNGGLPRVSSNAPLRGGKGSLFEGGVRVPTCAAWAGTIEAGSTNDTSITSVDLLPTFAELAGARLPTSQPVDGQSIAPLLRGDSQGWRERDIFWHYPLYLSGDQGGRVLPIFGTERLYWRAVPASMIRRGPWKLIRYYEDQSEHLYNVVTDVSETSPCNADHEAVAVELSQALTAWVDRVGAVVPTAENPEFSAPR